MNFLVGSASAKWAFVAPICPDVDADGPDPEATQAAYRVGDSITNIISPLMPSAIIIVFAQSMTVGLALEPSWQPCFLTPSRF